MTAFRLGFRLATARTGDELWRSLLIAAFAVVVSVTWLSGASVERALDAETDRVEARKPLKFTGDRDPVTAGDRDPVTGVEVRDVLDSINGEQFTVRWLEVRDGEPLPPGLTEQTVGSNRFAVSPALAAELDAVASTRFEPYGLIGDDGLRNRDELFAYALVPEESTLGNAGRPVVRFGSRNGVTSDVETFPLTMGLMAFLVVPCGVLLATATTARSEPHSYRCQLLGRLGVGRSSLAVMGAVESSVPAALGTAVGLLAHRLWSSQGDTIPVLDRHVVQGDLWLPAATTALVAFLVVAVVAALGAIVAVRRAKPGSLNRPTPSDVPLTGRRLAPFALGLVLLMVGLVQTGSTIAPRTILVGAVLIVAGVPFLLPIIVGLAGERLSRVEALTASMIGRRLQRDPRHATRPLLALGAATTLVVIVLGYLAVVRFDDEPRPPESDLRAATFTYVRKGQVADLSALSDDAVLFAPFDSNTFRIDMSCAGLTGLAAEPCGSDGRLSPKGRAVLGAALHIPPQFAGLLSLGTVTHADLPVIARGIALGATRPDFTEQVRSRLQAELPAVEVSDRREMGQEESPLVDWILTGLTIAIVLAAVALIALTVERYARSIQDHRILGVLGLSHDRHWRLETGQFLIVFTVMAGVALLCGIVAGIVMTRAGDVPFPTRQVFVATVLVLGLGVLASGAIAAISRSRLSRDDFYMTETGRARWTS